MVRNLWALLFLFGIGTWHSYATAETEIVSEHTELSRSTYGILRKFMEASGLEVLPRSAHATVAPFQARVRSMLDKLMKPEEKDGKVYFILANDPSFNAYFIQLDKNTRVVTIHAGLLEGLENDDELAFVLGHELEHGWSTLEKYAEGLQSEMRKKLLQRVVENEVDAKSVAKRMIPAGFNPYSADDVITRWRKAAPDHLSKTHTATSSRSDTMSLALTAMRKTEGMELPSPDRPRERRVIGAIKDRWIEQQAYVDYFVKEAEKVATIEIRRGNHLESTLKNEAVTSAFDNPSIADAIKDRNDLGRIGHQWTKSAGDRVERLLPSRISERTRADLVLKARSEMVAKWTDEINAWAGDPSHPLSPKDLARGLALLHYDTKPEAMDLEYTERDIKDNKQTIDETRERLKAPGRTQKQIKEDEDFLEYTLKKQEVDQTRLRRAQQQLKEARVHAKAVQKKADAFLSSHAEALLLKTDSPTRMAMAPLLSAHPDKDLRARYLPRVLEQFVKDFSALDANARFRTLSNMGVYTSAHAPVIELFQSAYAHQPARAKKLYAAFLRSIDPSNFDHWQHFQAFMELSSGFKQEPGLLETHKSVLHEAGKKLLQAWATEDPFTDWKDIPFVALRRTLEDRREIGSLMSTGVFENGLEGPEYLEARRLRTFNLVKIYRSSLSEPEKQLLSEEDIRDYVALFRTRETKLLPEEVRKLPKVIDALLSRSKNPIHIKWLALAAESFAEEWSLYRLMQDYGPLDSPTKKEKFFQFVLAYGSQMKTRRVVDMSRPLADPDMKVTLELTDWMAKNHPQETWLIRKILTPYDMVHRTPSLTSGDETPFYRMLKNIDYKEVRERKLHLEANTFKKHYRSYAKLGPRERALRSLQATATELKLEEVPAEIFQWLNAEGSTKHRAQTLLGMLDWSEVENALKDFPFKQVVEGVAEILNQPPLHGRGNEIELAEAFVLASVKSRKSTRQTEEIFEDLWKRGEKLPKLREVLTDEKLLPFLTRHAHRERVVKGILSRELGVSWKPVRNRQAGIALAPDNQKSQREVVKKSRDLIEKLLTKPSPLRDGILEDLGNALLTNAAETDYLFQHKISLERWESIEGLEALDAPQHIRNMQKPDEQLALLEYLTQQIDYPEAARRIKIHEWREPEAIEAGLKLTSGNFRDAQPLVRTYVLMSLLDPQKGLLAQAETAERVYEMILGPKASRSVLSEAVFRAYMKALPAPDQRVILAGLVATFTDRPRGASGVSLKSILESLGPIGVKAGQFFRTSGLAPKKYHSELDDLFSQAIPPTRKEVMDRMRRIYGKDLVDVDRIYHLLGSGSINYVVLADIRDPTTGVVRPVAVRFMRDKVIGQIRNEETLWKKVTAELNAHSDPHVRAFSGHVQEALNSSMETLREGGSEVDLIKDRELSLIANQGYGQAHARSSGYAIEALSFDNLLQMQVPAGEAKTSSILPFVDATEIHDVQDAKKLSQDILDAELRAIFEVGVFDPDGHPKNWLVDAKAKKLYRIDTSQLKRVEATERENLKRVFAFLLQPSPGKADLRAMAPALESIFDTKVNALALQNSVKQVVGSPGYRNKANPLERIFFLRDKVTEILKSQGLIKDDLIFSKQIRWVNMSLSKLNLYRERVGNLAFLQALANATKASKTRIALGYGKNLLKRCLLLRLNDDP